MVDLSPPFTSEVGQDVCEALENLFSLACNIVGPPRIPFFGLLALNRYPEVMPKYILSGKMNIFFELRLFGVSNIF